jgi:hypothetical protein
MEEYDWPWDEQDVKDEWRVGVLAHIQIPKRPLWRECWWEQYQPTNQTNKQTNKQLRGP